MHVDHKPYLRFSGRSRLDKAINTLIGITEGIIVDSKINSAEESFLRAWLHEHREVRNSHPYNELMPVVEKAIADGILESEEKLNIDWLCEKLQSREFYESLTAGIQRLHAVLGGIASDSSITKKELEGLSEWLSDHDYLQCTWPYEEVMSLVVGVLRDKKVDAQEHKLLTKFFGEFTALLDDRTITNPRFSKEGNIIGLCAVGPEIRFENKAFCLTGASTRYSRKVFSEVLSELGARVVSSVSKKLDYLIIGADGNPCWAYACYGRKVEAAVDLRREGARLLLVHENDLHDAIEDL
ncbi:MAG TPA: BRCT domain-containing protein [Gammaproteobacteria bacterium]